MRVQHQQVFKNNFVIDVSGVGVKVFDYTPADLKQIIESDILNNYDCITYLKSTVKVEEGLAVATNTSENVYVDIRLFFKCIHCEDADAMVNIITGYLKNTFIKNN
jgi:tRNA A-37 threonylcarbamoyl transferase component Bud32